MFGFRALLALLIACAVVVAAVEDAESELRARVTADQGDLQAALDLAEHLLRAEYRTPQGGRRSAEARSLFQRVLREHPPSPSVEVVVRSRLLALELDSGDARAALGHARALRPQCEPLLSAGAEAALTPVHDACFATSLRAAKALQQAGQEGPATRRLLRLVEQARGRHAGAFSAGAAALPDLDAALAEEVEALAETVLPPEEAEARRGEEKEGFVSEALGEEGFPGSSLHRRRRDRAVAKRRLGNRTDASGRAAWQGRVSLDPGVPPDRAWFAPLASAQDRAHILHALASHRDRSGETAGAWLAWTAANAWAHAAGRMEEEAGPGYEAAEAERKLDALRSAFDPDSGERPSAWAALEAAVAHAARDRLADQGSAPLLIVGLPRSGSSLLETLLSQHAEVWAGGEDTALAPLIPDLLGAMQRFLGGGHESERGLASEVAGLRSRYLEAMAAKRPPKKAHSRRVVDKMLAHAWNLGFVRMLFPNACILYVQRRPLDALMSTFAQPFEGRGLRWTTRLEDIQHYSSSLRAMMAHWEGVFPGWVLRMPYEALVRDPEGVLREICAHCGLAFEPGMLKATREGVRGGVVATASASQARRPLYAQGVGRWEAYAPLVEAALGPRMRREAALYDAWLADWQRQRQASDSKRRAGKASPSGHEEL